MAKNSHERKPGTIPDMGNEAREHQLSEHLSNAGLEGITAGIVAAGGAWSPDIAIGGAVIAPAVSLFLQQAFDRLMSRRQKNLHQTLTIASSHSDDDPIKILQTLLKTRHGEIYLDRFLSAVQDAAGSDHVVLLADSLARATRPDVDEAQMEFESDIVACLSVLQPGHVRLFDRLYAIALRNAEDTKSMLPKPVRGIGHPHPSIMVWAVRSREVRHALRGMHTLVWFRVLQGLLTAELDVSLGDVRTAAKIAIPSDWDSLRRPGWFEPDPDSNWFQKAQELERGGVTNRSSIQGLPIVSTLISTGLMEREAPNLYVVCRWNGTPDTPQCLRPAIYRVTEFGQEVGKRLVALSQLRTEVNFSGHDDSSQA